MRSKARIEGMVMRLRVEWPLGLALAAAMVGAAARAEPPAQRLFPTPEAAAAALTQAVEQLDRPAIAAIVGPDLAELIQGQGAEANEVERQRFLEAARRATVLRPDGDSRILEVGLEAWPFPAPLVHDAGGWRFDGAEGVEAVKDRIVGRNELEAIAVLQAYVDAQQSYAAEDRDGNCVLEYAQHLASTPGTHDGLYWPVTGEEEPSPLGPFLAEAGVTATSRDPATPYYGYYFRILTRQGETAPGGAYDYLINGHLLAGFAMVAWPAIYGESGVMTFIVNQYGVVLERDMGARTDEIGPKMLTYNPDAGWKPVD